jgi:hypothetical protein
VVRQARHQDLERVVGWRMWLLLSLADVAASDYERSGAGGKCRVGGE